MEYFLIFIALETYKKAKKVSTSSSGANASDSNNNNIGAFKNSQLLSQKIEKNMVTIQSHNLQNVDSSRDSIKNSLVRSIPKKQSNSGLDVLLNAYRINNPIPILPNGEVKEKMRKRDDKNLEKQLQSILSNNENPLKSSQQIIGMRGLQDTLQTILNKNAYPNPLNLGRHHSSLLQNSSEGRKSSSEIEENLKHKTPVKIKYSKVYQAEDYSSPKGNKGHLAGLLSKSSQPYVMKTPKKYKNTHNLEKESCEIVSRIKRNVQEGNNVKLVLDSNSDSSSRDITLHIGSRSVAQGFDSGIS